MEKSYDTDQWSLRAFLDWVPKDRSAECDTCSGTGKVGGHFKDLDGERVCPNCHGSRFVRLRPEGPAPEIPKDVLEHMRRAWWDFFNGAAPTGVLGWTDDQMISFAGQILLQGNHPHSISMRLDDFRKDEALRGQKTPEKGI